MTTKTDWDDRFQEIDLCIASKNFSRAKTLIDRAITKANRVLIDPSFLVKELEKQKNSLPG